MTETLEASAAPATPWPVSARDFLGRRPESEEVKGRLAPEAQAALRQFSTDRLLGYGIAAADAWVGWR